MATKTPTSPTTTEVVKDEAAKIEQSVSEAAASAKASIDQGIATARDQAGPMVEKAKQFAKDRPWTAAALIGSIAVAVMGSLRRGKL